MPPIDSTIYIVAGVVIIVIVVVIVTVTVVRKKKNKAALPPAANVGVGFGVNNSSGEKEIKYANNAGSKYTVKISHSLDPNKTWTFKVGGDILIGRAEHCPIRLEDRSVSGVHCRITVQSAGLAVIHDSKTNKTLINGSIVYDSYPLNSGDTLKVGRETLVVDYIQVLGDQPPKPEPPKDNSGGETVPIF